ncbi:MAG: cyclase family protein [Firmicutes bacterium]|jgi:kynurenine formamidase|nr:cyclase family protein [Bacillota bacterium]
MNIIDFWKNVKMYDLTQNLSHLTPPWPTYEPLQIKFFKRLSSNGANGQVITTSNHVGTHLDGSMHFITHGRDISEIPLEELCNEAVVVDLSDIAEDYGIYTSKDIEERVEVKEGDILIIYTGYSKYGWDQPEADEERYMLRHPGPTKEFSEWAIEKKIKWIGVDAGSADHPMNTKIREWCPKEAVKAEKYLQEKYGKGLDDFWPEEDYQLMHYDLFPHDIIHAENLGGDIAKIVNKRLVVGCFPWRFQGGESSIARVVAFDAE